MFGCPWYQINSNNSRTFPREVVLAVIALVFTFWIIAGSGQLAVNLAFLIFLIDHCRLGRGEPKMTGSTHSESTPHSQRLRED